MNHIFLDTNILIDFLADRKPFSQYAASIFSLADKGKVKIYISAISFNNVYYIIKQVSSHNKAIKLISELESLAETIDVNKDIIKKSIRSDFNDFEDAVQYFSAITRKKIEFIVTRNIKDFKNSQLPVFSPESAIGLLTNNV